MQPSVIKYVSNGSFAQNGSAISFRVEAEDGTRTDLALSSVDVQRFLTYIITLSQEASTRHALPQKVASMPLSTWTEKPIKARDIAFTKGRTPSEQLLAVDLGPFKVVFAVPA